MIKETEYWENQEGFDPNALRQAFQEQLEKWAEEYGLEKEQDEEFIETDSCMEDLRTKDGDWWKKAYFDIAFGEYVLYLRLSWDKIIKFCYKVQQFSQKSLAYFACLYIESGDIALQRALELRAQIEKRIREIEQEQLEEEWTDKTK